jgi:hypothetical protein
MIQKQDGRFALEVDFVLLPSLEEMQDTSSDDVYAGPLSQFEISASALENECRDKIHLPGDIRVWTLQDESLKHGYMPLDILVKFAAWLGSAAGCSILFKLFTAWMGLHKGRKIIAILPDGLHLETSEMSEKQFLTLMEGLSTCNARVERLYGVTESKRLERLAYVPEKYRPEFEKFLEHLRNSGSDVFESAHLEKLRDPLYTAYTHSLGEIRNAPDFSARTERSLKKIGSREAIYLSDLKPSVDPLEPIDQDLRDTETDTPTT